MRLSKTSICYFLCFLLICAAYLFRYVLDRQLLLILSLIIVYTACFCFLLFNTPKGIVHSKLILLGFLIVYTQNHIDLLMGYESIDNTFLWVKPEYALKSIIFSATGLLFYFIGYSQSVKFRPKETLKNKVYESQNTGLLSFLSLFFLIEYFINVNPLYLAGFYGMVEMGDGAARFILLFKVTTYLVTILNVWNAILRGDRISSLRSVIRIVSPYNFSLIFVYIISVLLSGDRGPIISYGLLFLSVYLFLGVRSIKLFKMIGGAAVGIVLISSLAVIRNLDKNLGFVEKIEQSLTLMSNLEDASVVNATKELAGSLKTFNAAMNYIDEGGTYKYGRFQLQQILIAVPFVLPLVNEILFFRDGNKTYSTANYSTWLIQGDNPSYGNGTSILTDLYLDFGFLGIVLGMFSLGFFVKFCEFIFMEKPIVSPVFYIISIVYFTSAIYLSRSSILFEVQTIGWILIVYFMNNVFNKTLAFLKFSLK